MRVGLQMEAGDSEMETTAVPISLWLPSPPGKSRFSASLDHQVGHMTRLLRGEAPPPPPTEPSVNVRKVPRASGSEEPAMPLMDVVVGIL